MAKVYWSRGITIRRTDSSSAYLGSLDGTVGSSSTHYLAFKKSNTIYYLPLTTTASGNLRIRKDSTTYSIDNKYRIRLNVSVNWSFYSGGSGGFSKEVRVTTRSSSGIDILAPNGGVISGTDMDITITPNNSGGGNWKAWFYANGSKYNNFKSEGIVALSATTSTQYVTVVRGSITATVSFSVNCNGASGNVDSTYIYIDII